MIATVLWWLGAGVAVAAAAYLLLALAAVAAYRPQTGPGWAEQPAVTLLKPLCGMEDGLEQALASFLAQETRSPVEFVFGVADAGDPALALAHKVAARFPDRAVRFVADGQRHGPNPKVGNLINMAKGGLGGVVAISDSDTVLAPGALQRAIDALAAPGTGAVTALYRGKPGSGGASRTSGVWFLDYWFLPMALLHARLAPLSVTYGPLTLVRREVLEQAGGLIALADHLSDDAELGKRVRAAGYAVAFTPDIAETLVNDASLGELFDHELRWSRTVRGLDPLGFAASVVSHPGPLPLLMLVWPGWLALAGVLTPVLLRMLLAALVRRRFGHAETLRMPGPLAVWLRDGFCFAVWAAACVVRQVGWRGQRLGVHSGDILVPLKGKR